MKCPYCGGEEHFDNSSINHKIKHNDCNKYFKVCSFCSTKYIEDGNNYVDTNAIRVDNLFDADYCIKCGREWLPDFPTSWLRSLTNIGKIYDVINDCTRINSGEIRKETLLELQRSHNGVTFNKERAKARGAENYITGALERRMADYILVLRNMQVLINANKGKDNASFELSRFGEGFATSDNTYEIFAYYITACCNIKINNGFQKTSKSSVYSYFKIRYIENILNGCNEKRKNGSLTSIEDFGVTLLSRNEEEFKSRALEYIKLFNRKGLQDKFFNATNKELNRSVKGAFVNILVSLGVLKKVGDLYDMTAIGGQVLVLLNKFPAIWYEDISDNQSIEENIERVAYIISWRLLKNNLLDQSASSLKIKDIEKYIVKFIPNISQCEDIHFNLLYDEPLRKNDEQITYRVIHYMSSIIFCSVSEDALYELCQELPYVLFTKIYKIVSDNKNLLEPIIENIDSDTFRQNTQSGKRWHDKVRNSFVKIGIDTKDYREEPLFERIIIDRLDLNLPGGTVYNPDILLFDSSYGKRGCILVDAKDENSINAEVHKLMGYNTYSSDPRVNTYCIIALRGKLPDRTKTRILNNVKEFDKIVIIEEKALDLLVEKKVSKKRALQILYPNDGFKLITRGHIEAELR